jgi:hypothetical protein
MLLFYHKHDNNRKTTLLEKEHITHLKTNKKPSNILCLTWLVVLQLLSHSYIQFIQIFISCKRYTAL